MSADEELGYFYLPLSTPTNDWYGGQRLGDNLFAESLVCVEAKTGKRVWHFQTVHHGVWDYDLPAAPILCDIKVDGKEIPAVAQITKTGFTFVFNRKTGEPVWPIEETPGAGQHRAGREALADATGSRPSRPRTRLQGATEENLIDFTPELRAEAKEIARQVRSRPAVHAAHGEGHDQPAGLGRRCELVGRGVRSGHGE